MRIVARVSAADGAPLSGAPAELVIPKGGETAVVGQGAVKEGSLSIDLPGDVGMAWGIRIDGRPVLAAVASLSVDAIELGEIRLLASPLPIRAFHAPDGLVYGLARETAAAGETLETPIPARMTFGDLFGSTARQLGAVVADPTSGLTLTAASITLQGVPTATADAVGLQFPDLSTVGSVPLSEISFSLRPRLTTGETAVPAGPVTPGLVGYTRELALRKVAAAGLVAEVAYEIVDDPGRVGRVTRQVPAAAAPVTPGEVVRLFVGKNDEG